LGQAHALISLLILLLPFLGALLLILAISIAGHPVGGARIAVALYASGFALFLVAKISMIRSGRLVTLGSRLMRPRYRALYRIGYVLMVAGLIFTVATVIWSAARR
jgi:hypothetical protein